MFKRFCLIWVVIAFVFLSCGGNTQDDNAVTSVSTEHKKGIICDKVIFSVNMDETVALKDVVEGKQDVLFTRVPPAILNTLSDADRDKLDIYTIPAGSWSLWLNPIPNKAPYTHTLNTGETVFNPLALQKVRYALNWLVDRKKIINEVLGGEGDPMFTPMTPGQPGTYRYNLIPIKLGMSDNGDEKLAIEMITKALEEASQLPSNRGKLIKKDKFWQYEGKDILVKFFIRVDDATGRLPAGRYIADQIEKAGIKVERLEWDRSRSSDSVYGANPADYICTMYTEAWSAGATRRWWDVSVCQMFAPFYGYMPGGSNPGYWNYENARLDELGKKGQNGQYLKEKDYWAGNLEATEIGLKEAVRIYLLSNKDSFVANKARFNSRMLYGVGDGLNGWSIRSADVKPDTSGVFKGQKVLRVSQHSARGSLFMSSWDPVGRGGFTDSYCAVVTGATHLKEIDEAPHTAEDITFGCNIDVGSAQVSPKILSDGTIGGDVEVPSNAIIFDTKTKEWKEVGKGITVAVGATGSFVDGFYWHNGEAITPIDERYASAFIRDWCTKDGEDDPYYDEALSANLSEELATSKGTVYNENGSMTFYKNFFFAPDSNRTITTVGAPSSKAGNPGRPTVVPWEINEALAEMVVHGAASGTKYNFLEAGQGATEVDVVSPPCVADIKEKLQELMEAKHVPVYIKGLVDEDYCVKRYKASIDFIEKYGHAYIGNGALMLTKIDTNTNSIMAESFDKFPYQSDYWVKKLTIPMSSIDYIKAPNSAKPGDEAVFEINISQFIYPNNELTAMIRGTVLLRLQNDDGTESVFTAEKIADGKFRAVIPQEKTSELISGRTYTVVVTSSVNEETPSVQTSKLSML